MYYRQQRAGKGVCFLKFLLPKNKFKIKYAENTPTQIDVIAFLVLYLLACQDLRNVTFSLTFGKSNLSLQFIVV